MTNDNPEPQCEPDGASGSTEPAGSRPSLEPPVAGGAPTAMTRSVTSGAGARRAVTVGALGVVFGDIGTSPLYAIQTVFSIDRNRVGPNPVDVYGVISLVFWSITMIVSVKYVLFVLRADNDGEGGVMALAALTRGLVRPGGRRYGLAMALGVVGAALFYGDSVITPAISVLSAVEGLSVPAPGLASAEVPLGAAVIVGLFLVQRFGTRVVGGFFGPVMVVWFILIGVLGVKEVIQDPSILQAVLPGYALAFLVHDPVVGFVAMGAVVLAITGAEALYADMGHFGRPAIRRAWFALVLPSLTLNYLGQGALLLRNPAAIDSLFFHLGPGWLQLPLVVLATAATVIASQAVISGAYSVSRQAQNLGYLPRLTIRQTSEQEHGQIYAPAVNWTLFIGVLTLLLVFRTSGRLATAYGLAVTGTFLLTTTLFLMHARFGWGWSWTRLVVFGLPVYLVEGTFLAANLTKVYTGGWLPLLIAAVIIVVMTTWQRGRTLVTTRRSELEGRYEEFVEWLRTSHVHQVPGTAVFLHPDRDTVPLALRENVAVNRVIHQNVVIVTVEVAHVPHVPDEGRIQVDDRDGPGSAVTRMALRYGFKDDQNVPAALRLVTDPTIAFDPDNAYYFLSRVTIGRGSSGGLNRWRQQIFIALAHNAADPTVYFSLPEDRTIVMGAQVSI